MLDETPPLHQNISNTVTEGSNASYIACSKMKLFNLFDQQNLFPHRGLLLLHLLMALLIFGLVLFLLVRWPAQMMAHKLLSELIKSTLLPNRWCFCCLFLCVVFWFCFVLRFVWGTALGQLHRLCKGPHSNSGADTHQEAQTAISSTKSRWSASSRRKLLNFWAANKVIAIFCGWRPCLSAGRT